MDRDAGSTAARPHRAWTVLAAGLLLAACTLERRPAADEAGRPSLAPVRTLQGGRLATRVDALGTPLPGALAGQLNLVFPAAVAVAGPDLYIADAGAGRVYRFEPALFALVPVPGIAATPGTRLQGGPDGLLYVLDAGASEVRRLPRTGRALPALAPRLPASRYVEFAVDPATGRVFAADGANGTVDRFEPTGRQAIVVQAGSLPGPLASDGRSLYLAEAGCRCILQWRDGVPAPSLAEGELALPRALAAGEGVLVAIDGADRSLLVVTPSGTERIAASRLGMLAPEGLAIGGGLLYVADGAGQAVHVFRLPARRRAP